MSNRRIRWIIGFVLLTAIIGVILFYPLGVLLNPKLQYVGLYSRAIYMFLLCLLFCLFRIFKGPTPADRIVSIDIMGILIIGLCAILSVSTGRSWYIDIGIAWALQSFIGTLALAKYLEGKHFDD